MLIKLKKQIAVELEQLDLLVKRYPALIQKCRNESPSELEKDALSALIHSFYSGIENLFKRISIVMDGGPLRGELWHAKLLEQMAQATSSRPAVISEDLRRKLKDYLDFRHVFRHAYVFELKWPRMASLVLEMESVLRQLEEEVAQFLSAIETESR
jgi:hypothetical protein